jgi:ubiquinone/menaquinone biosynthesis C-methylase UbiE
MDKFMPIVSWWARQAELDYTLHPMVNASDGLREHFDARAHSYADATPWVTDPRSLEPIARVVAGMRVRHALEIGVGSGAVPSFLRRRDICPVSYVGLDLSAAMLRHSDGWLPVQGNATQLPFCDDTMDLLIMRQAFHYFEHPAEVLLEGARVLAESGALLVAQITPFDDVEDIIWWSRAVTLRQPFRRHLWTNELLENVLSANGFSIISNKQVLGRSSLRNWISRYPMDDNAAQELVKHYQNASDIVRRVRAFEFRPDGDIQFSIRWTILFARQSNIIAHRGRPHV